MNPKTRFNKLILTVAVIFTSMSYYANVQDFKPSKAEKIKSKVTVSYKFQIELINSYINNSEYEKANNLCDKLLTQNRKNQKKNVEIYLVKARIYTLLNSNDEAIKFLLNAKEIALKYKNYKDVIQSGVQLIEVYRKIGSYKNAEKSFYLYSYLAKKYGVRDPKIWNGLYNRFAAVANESGRARLSVKYSKLALKEAQKTDDKVAMAISFNELGFSHKNLLDTDKALTNYKAAEKIYTDISLYRDLVHVKMNILYLLAHNNLISQEEILASANAILKIIEEKNVDYPKSKPLELIRNYYEATKQFKKAYFAINTYNYELTEEAKKINESQITEIVEQYQNNKLKKENELIRLNAKNEEKLLKAARIQLLLVILILIILTGSFFVLNYHYRKSKRQNKMLDEQNEEKSLLIQEIHHRVKNNLQFVHSMLELQKNSLKGEDSQGLDDLSRRINAMSLIHEQLYLSNDQEGINIKTYITSLMKHTSSIFTTKQFIDITIDVPNIDIAVDKALPIGIICAELFNNSVKHAFTNHTSPKFSICISENNSFFLLNVSDNGNDKKEIDTDKNATTGLGTRLVDIFSRQLKGEYVINKDNGYEYILEFKL